MFSVFMQKYRSNMFFNTLTFAKSLGRCWKPRPSASVFNTSHGTWWILMHEKNMFDPYNEVNRKRPQSWSIDFLKHRKRDRCGTSHYENMSIQVYWKFYHQKWKFSDKKKSDMFHISAQNIDCGYSLERPRRGGSNEYPQSMILSRNKKIMYTPVNPSFTI